MGIDIGLIAYQAYRNNRSDITLPDWNQLGKLEQDAWRAAAIAVLQYIDHERGEIFLGYTDMISGSGITKDSLE